MIHHLAIDDYEEPEILRVPLEQIVVMSKVHGPSTPAVQFLGQALQPPVKEAGMHYLCKIEFCDASEFNCILHMYFTLRLDIITLKLSERLIL